MDVKRLKALIAKKQIRIAELADRAGVSQDVIYKLLSGHRNPTLKTVGKLAAALDVEPGELLKGE